MSNDGDTRPYDPAGTRPKVDPATLHATQAPPDLPWAEREERADDALEQAIDQLEEIHADEELEDSSHLGRFQFVLGGLIAIAAIAIAAIVLVFVAGRDDGPSTNWSAWHPSGSDTLQQIADHVGGTYRLDSGDPIALVTGGPLEFGTDQKVPVKVVAASRIQDGKTALFTMCGTGEDCAIAGKSSDARGLLVRREALELALYTMHYTDADQVVVMMPPVAGGVLPVDRAVFLRRDDLKPEVDQPLRATLPTAVPSLATIDRSPGIGAVKQFAGMYGVQLSQASDGSAYLVLGTVEQALAAAQQSAAAAAATAGVTGTTGTTGTTATTPQTITAPQAKTTPQKAKKDKDKKGG